MATSSLLLMASFFSPDAFAAEPEPLEPGEVQLSLTFSDGSSADLHLLGVEPCSWQHMATDSARCPPPADD
ncbi:MAG: hypothetical protein H6742_08410 [Alphaproteobacteria bacterium]|nr:hypothetical protein [Alphaproteobacteria bacterium]